jgi:hypothetical protein
MADSYKEDNITITLVIAISTNLISSIIFYFFTDFTIQLLVMGSINFILVIFLLLQLKSINYLIYINNRNNKIDSPKDSVIDEAVIALIKLGYIHSNKEDALLRSYFKNAKYIRAQNFLRIFQDGIIEVTDQFLFIDDHPFSPFSQIVINHIAANVKQIGVGAIPDSLYSKEDINARIKFIEEENGDYFFLPKDDLNMSILIFDEKAAIVYTTPHGRESCNFSELLLITDHSAIMGLTKVFWHIFSLAKKQYKGKQENVVKSLKNIRSFYVTEL